MARLGFVVSQIKEIEAARVARRSGWERSGNQDRNPVSRHCMIVVARLSRKRN
jgi:hypothetical protein